MTKNTVYHFSVYISKPKCANGIKCAKTKETKKLDRTVCNI